MLTPATPASLAGAAGVLKKSLDNRPEETTKLEETAEPEETRPANHGVEGGSILTLRALDYHALLPPEDITEEVVVPITPSESLSLVVEYNQDNARKNSSKESLGRSTGVHKTSRLCAATA